MAEEASNVLTPEEEYLLKVFNRGRRQAREASPTTTIDKLLPSRRSPSPVPPQTKTPFSSTGRPNAAGTTTIADGSKNHGASSSGGEKETPEEPDPTPMDARSRAKMILEKKRKVAAGMSRAGSAASGAAGVLRKAKISRIAGMQSSSAVSAKLDPVKVCRRKRPQLGLQIIVRSYLQ